jgi:TRAP-type transport system periplasmic protein
MRDVHAMLRSAALLALSMLVAAVIAGSAQAAEAVLTALTALPKNHDLSESFLALFVEKVNATGKGVVHIDYKGGPEVTPPNKLAQAVQRGAIDMIHSPAAYYAGITPQSSALMATNRTPAEIRANGGFDMIQQVWHDKLNVKIVAWAESGAQFHLYLVKEPPLKADGTLDLTGLKMRSTGAYRPLLTALGASPVEMPVSDVYTALQRGLVDGFGWPTVGLASQGLAKAIKYRIDPPFYHLANLVLVNEEKWNALPPAAKDVLIRVGAEYELSSAKRMQDAAMADEEAIKKEGVKIFELKGKAADAYLSAAYGAAWERIATRLDKDEVTRLRAKLLK